jgi:CRISPR-associated protein Csy2
MTICPRFDRLLILPRLRVQNANAISSPLTHGFPSITAFLGLMWALERKTRAKGLDISFKAVGVVSHDHDEQVTDDGFVKKFRLTRNPVDGKGETAAIVEEGRIHLELSLVLALSSPRWDRDATMQQVDIATIAELVAGMRIAGGSVLPPRHAASPRHQPYVVELTGSEEGQAAEFRRARYRLLPGFALVSRDDLLDVRHAELQQQSADASRLDAWLSLSRVEWRYTPADDEGSKGEWRNNRRGKGWIVPIPVGYGGLGDLHPPGHAANARDATTPFRFVESLYSVGQWISPHRLNLPEELLWYADSRSDKDLYRCRNDYQPAQDAADSDSD